MPRHAPVWRWFSKALVVRILVVDTYYERFLADFYQRQPGASRARYDAQWRALMDECFGTADFYSYHLTQLGHEAHEVVANCDVLQRRWALEHAFPLWLAYPLQRRLGRTHHWRLAVLRAQVEALRPDVLYVQDLNWTDGGFLRSVRGKTRLIVGQTAYGLRDGLDYGAYDLLISSFPHYVADFRRRGVASEYLRFAFDTRILKKLHQDGAKYSVTFVGGFSPRHARGTEMFEQLARHVPVDFWGYGAETLPADSAVRRRYRGEAWGIEMYRILSESKIALNRHIDVAQNVANNMRLFEATGVGACLVTDKKDNLHELFEPDSEVVAYATADECLEKVRYLLEHDDERAAIARAGQQRVLREHTYQHRMQELADLMERHLVHPTAATRTTAVSSARGGAS